MKFRRSPIAAAVLAFHALPGAAQEAAAPPAAGPAQTLPAVKVQDEAVNEYKAERISSPKFTQPLINTPQTITVIKKEVMAEQGALSLSDALRNTPGITFQMGENGNSTSGDAIFMRGFDTQGSVFLDNIRDLGPAVRDLFNVEQVEIVKGPAGADNGRGAASGYVNLVSKTPFAERLLAGSLGYGSAQRRRVTADLNEPVGQTTAVRLNLLGQEGGVAGRDFIERSQWGIAPSLALGLGTGTRVTVFGQHIEQNNTPDGGISAIGISGYRNLILEGRDANGNPTNSTGTRVDARPVDIENFYGLEEDFEDITADIFTVRVEHDLEPGTTLRNTSRYGKSDQERQLTAPLQAPVVSDDPDGTGPQQPVVRDPEDWTQGRSRQGSYRENQILTNQTNLSTAFRTGFVEHLLSGGVEFIYESQFTPTYAVVGAAQVATSLYNPDRTSPAATLAPNGVFTDGDTTTAALYVFDTLKLGERWQLNGGLRVERYKTETNSASLSTATSHPSLPVGTLIPAHVEAADNLVSWKLGALFKPLPNGSVYVAYANSLRPPGGDNFSLAAATTGAANTPTASINSSALDPQDATNVELGTKWDLLDGRLAATAALFQSDNRNDLARLSNDTVVQYGKKEVKGVELGLVGQLLTGWQASFGYTFQETEVSQGTIATDGSSTQTGALINFSPKHSATVWTTYELPLPLPRPLTIGGGFRYVDSQARTVNNNLDSITTGIVKVDSYSVVDAMASYDFTAHLGLQLNVYNLLDEQYVAAVNNSGQRYFPGTPRSYLLTLNAKF